MTTHTTTKAPCERCNATGEVWDDDMDRLKPCGSCLGHGWLAHDVIHIPSPIPNPDADLSKNGPGFDTSTGPV